jgi:hypothetical protein
VPGLQAGVGAQFFLDEILDRFHVVVGGGLDRLDTCAIIDAEIGGDRLERLDLPALNAGSSTICASAASASSHSISTCTRRCIRPNSLKIGRSGSTLLA